jgi:hypothetical protein
MVRRGERGQGSVEEERGRGRRGGLRLYERESMRERERESIGALPCPLSLTSLCPPSLSDSRTHDVADPQPGRRPVRHLPGGRPSRPPIPIAPLRHSPRPLPRFRSSPFPTRSPRVTSDPASPSRVFQSASRPLCTPARPVGVLITTLQRSVLAPRPPLKAAGEWEGG